MNRLVAVAAVLLLAADRAAALDPQKRLTQYTRTVWTQEHGLPQDTIRAIAQTADGYLWLGTDEGLARFDGYEFVVYHKNGGSLPGNSVTVLYADRDGSLWIGTSDGLTHYQGGRFTTYTTKDGLIDNAITSIFQDHEGALWIAAGVFLSRFQDGHFLNYLPKDGLPIQAVRAIYEDRQHTLWIAGFGGVVQFTGGRFVTVIGPAGLNGNIVTVMLKDHRDHLWIAGSKGLLELQPDGKLNRYDERSGLADIFVRALWEDRDGNLWAGTNNGLSRLERGRFVTLAGSTGQDSDWVRCIFEDREGNLWVGMNSGLNRLRDDQFTIYGRSEGLPSDEPTTVYQDRQGRIWIGFHDAGLMEFSDTAPRVFTARNGLVANEIFSIREDRQGGLLIGTRLGMSRMRGERFENSLIPDPLGRNVVFDALEDRGGRIWAATASGLHEILPHPRLALEGGPLLANAFVVLCETNDGSLWAGTYGKGLWRVKEGERTLFTMANGLGSDQIRSLYEDQAHTLWIGTFGGGLSAFRDGRFLKFAAKDGLLSDNISHVEDDGAGSLWLATTRGICRIAKKQLEEFAAGQRRMLQPANYGVGEGLRSAQCAPGYPTSGGGESTRDGALWFPTSRGIAVLRPGAVRNRSPLPLSVHLVDVTADGKPIDFAHDAVIPPGSGRLQFHYTGIHLSAPELVRYSHRLEGLDSDWIRAGSRRVINYNSLGHGTYRFVVRAEAENGTAAETAFSFTVQPYFYETTWFLILSAMALGGMVWAVYQLRLRQIRERFALVLQERARLAREIHDTLAQGFVGISSQLDAVALTMDQSVEAARKHLDLARKMARHSLTEARRSVMDLRASALEDQDLASAIAAAARQWTAGSPVEVKFEAAGEARKLSEDIEQNLLRIAQEAVTNAVKHSRAKRIQIRLGLQARTVTLQVVDDGCGFDPNGIFSELGGHFGLIGMRERAERLGGEFALVSLPGEGTQVDVTVPIS